MCELFNVSVEHRFLNTPIKYENLKKSRKTMFFSSNGGHFKNNGSAKKTNSSQSRLERIKTQAINNHKNNLVYNNKKTENIPSLMSNNTKRPSWRAQPDAYKTWRQNMRSMNIR